MGERLQQLENLHQNAKSIIGQRKEIKPLLLDLIKDVVRCSISFNIVSVMLISSPAYLHDNEDWRHIVTLPHDLK